MIGGRFRLIPQKSHSERFVESIYAFSILMLLVMAIASIYIIDLVLPHYYGNLLFLFFGQTYRISLFAIFILVLVIGYAHGKNPPSIVRRRALVKITRISMLVFMILAFFTFSFWNSNYQEPIQVAFFVFFNLIEVFILEIHNMAFSVHGPRTAG